MHPSFLDFYRANIGLVKQIAGKVYGRALKAGIRGLEYEDIEQEATLVLMKTYTGFNPELGYKFSTYFVRAAYNQLNRFLEKFESDCVTTSLDGLKNNESDQVDWSDLIGSDSDTPESLLEAKQVAQSIENYMTPLAVMYVSLLLSPPSLMQEEWHRRLHIEGAERHTEMSVDFVARYMAALTGESLEVIMGAIRNYRNARKAFDA